MKKFIMSILTSVCILFGCASFTACDGLDEALDLAFENEILREENDSLKDQITELESEVATLKFEATFVDRLITESCILNKVRIINEEVKEDGSVWAIRTDGAEVEVTINDGLYDAGVGSLYNIAVWAHNNSKVIINGGVFKTGADINGEANHVIYAAGNSVIEINGGWFESVGVDAPMMVNCQDGKGTIVVKGGTFVNFDPSNCVSEGVGTNFVAEGYIVEKETVNGVDYYKVVKAPEVEEEVIEL